MISADEPNIIRHRAENGEAVSRPLQKGSAKTLQLGLKLTVEPGNRGIPPGTAADPPKSPKGAKGDAYAMCVRKSDILYSKTRRKEAAMAERKKLKVYLESSFVSYLTGRETDDAKIAADQAHTRRWMREQADLCELKISQFVVDESMKGPRADVARREAFMRGKKFAAADMRKVSRLAKQLLKEHALPPKEVTDAFHIATASVAGMDVLLTWNCRHMANPHSLPLTKKIVRKAGFHCPDIMTPKTFLDNIDLEK